MKKTTLFSPKFIVIGSLFALVAILTTSFGDKRDQQQPPPKKRDLQQDPPIAAGLFVRRLKEPLPTGENMVIDIQYPKGVIEGDSVTLYPNEDTKITFYDDGDSKLHGDAKKGDNIFSAFIKDDPEAFQKQMEAFQNEFEKNDNTLLVFKHRVGKQITRKTALFNTKLFLASERVEIPRDIFNIPVSTDPTAATLQVKQVAARRYAGRRLFLRDTSTGTAAIFTTGFPPAQGFGPPPPPPVIVKQNSLFITDQLVVSDPARTFNPCDGSFGSGNPAGAWTFGTLIRGMAFESSTGISAKDFTRHWLRRWMVDTTVNGEFVKNRSANMLNIIISRWIKKARHNAALPITAANWETEWTNTNQDSLLRYAPFSLKAIVNRLDLRGNFGYAGSSNNAGETRFIFSIIQNTISGTPPCRDSLGIVGFDGFNVIFEYGNIQNRCSALKAFAMDWANLSTMAVGSPTFLSALEAITHLVTDSNKVAAKPNQNALDQLRTNEIAITNTTNTTTDKSPRWQFREFKIQASNHQLEQVPIHDEPANLFNGADGATAANAAIMAGWVNSHASAIIAQSTTGIVPLTVGATQFQAGKVNYASTSSVQAPGFWNGTSSGAGFINSDSARFFFSLNTCTGCHSAETHTDFTELNYVGIGTSYSAMTNTVQIITSGTEHKIDISPFLTGRDAIASGGTFIFGDDSTSATENATDNTLTGLFFANDAAGRKYPGTTITRKWGFNDLQRRAQDLSNLINSFCINILPINLAQIVFFQPLNMSH